MNPFSDLTHPRNDPLQRLIKEGVQALENDPTEPGKYLTLVELGYKHRSTVSPEHFRDRLLEAGLIAPRASEIKTILKHGWVARRFINRKLNVRTALTLARSKPGSGTATNRNSRRTPGPGSPARARRAAVRALKELLAVAGSKNRPWPLDCGLFQIQYFPAAPAQES